MERPTIRKRAPKPPGRLLVVSGPSGVGKSAVAARLLLDRRFGRAVTATTRAPRKGERNGRDYVFLDAEEFVRRERAGWFLEYATVYGQLYGTPREHVEKVLASGRHCVLVVDVQGAATLRDRGIEAEFVFLLPPSTD
jgi:guanylate kinase